MTIVTARRADFASVARRYAANPHDWPFAPRFDPHERWYGRLAEAVDHEVWLLTWLPGQGTDLHDHGGSAGAFVVVEGEIVEQTVQRGALHDATLHSGDARSFGPHHVHRVLNRSTRPAVTVHVYGPALRSMAHYRLEAGALTVTSVARAGADW